LVAEFLMYVVSFSGPARTSFQEADFVEDIVARKVRAARFVSGGAYGVDTAAAYGVDLYGLGSLHFVVPASLPNNRKFVKKLVDDDRATVEYVSGTYMDRNDRLVELADELVAFPRTREEERRSGTWATIRRAWKAKVPVTLYPLSECSFIL